MHPAAPNLDLLLIRHASTAWTLAGRYQGRKDPRLSPAGHAEAARLAGQLGRLPIGVILSSPQARALETARLLAETTGAPLRIDPRLVELDHGQWEGLTQAEVKARWPGDLRAWKRTPASACPTGGEMLAVAAARLTAVLADLARQPLDGPIAAIVTHEVLIRLALLAARGQGPEEFRSLSVKPASAHPLHLRDGRLVPCQTFFLNPVFDNA